LAKLPFSLPLLGSHLNALPIIMAGAMFLQTKMSQSQMPSAGANPTAKLMTGPMMSIVFGIMFYQLPAGLVLYWLMNSLMSVLMYKLAK
jgi:YidC/Oxa1 family membrane protein insertase